MPDRPHAADDVALSLTLAIVSASAAPLLLLDDQLVIVAASRSFYEAFEEVQTDVVGHALPELGAGEWNIPELQALVSAAISGALTPVLETDFAARHGRTRRLVVQASRLEYLDLDHARILVAVSDVTDDRVAAALKDAALEQNHILLQEVRHRVANSLQIIASILLQNARKTHSEETRSHLRDAHHRVMSVAALERMLSTTDGGGVEVKSYLNRLCDSISASMIGDAERVSLTVEGGDGVVEARVSVSLGLIVTELVINALKHAFPSDRSGRIVVEYSFQGPNWELSVLDDGVGLPPDQATDRTGLGTSIIEALARQLDARVEITPEQPGTRISIHHEQIVLVQGGSAEGKLFASQALVSRTLGS